MMKQPESQYQSYLLRLWRDGEGKAWRVMLEHISTHERHGFADMEGLCTFLREQMNDQGKIGEKGISDGKVSEAAILRGIDALNEFQEYIQQNKVDTVKAIATSAIRSAANQEEVVQRFKDEIGVVIEVVSGAREAELIYKGIKSEIGINHGRSLILDLGGGSVEFIICDAKEIFWKRSIEVGAQRLLDKFHLEDPITVELKTEMEAFLTDKLEGLVSALNEFKPKVVIGSSGAFDSVAEIYEHRQGNEDFVLPLSYELPIGVFLEIQEELSLYNYEERKSVGGLIPLRAEMIVVATLLVKFVLAKMPVERLFVSQASLKDGVFHELNTNG